MEFTITTNHKVAYQVKKCFESKVLKFEENKGLKLVELEVNTGFAILYIHCNPAVKAQSIFFLGVHAEAYRVEPELKFDFSGLLPFTEAFKLLSVQRAKS